MSKIHGREEKAKKILKLLQNHYPHTRTSLRYRTPFELFVAVVLSAQTTDRQVNRVTARLFKKFDNPRDMAQAEPEELEMLLKGCGLFRSKSRYLIDASRMIMSKFGGQVPGTVEELTMLPGVGRKAANVILSNVFKKPALAVDTHVYRVAHRLGLVEGKTVRETEEELCQLIPQEKWGEAHHQFIAHGRKICHSRNPRCSECFLLLYCCYGCQKAIKEGERK